MSSGLTMSIFDHPDTVPTVATWRCPHCGTLQPEASRCWACLRSPVSCATCRYYRRSLVSRMGLCGLDPSRGPLDGDEIQPCWLPAADVPTTGIFASAAELSTTRSLERTGAPRTRMPAPAARVAAATRQAAAGAPSEASTLALGRLVEAPMVRPSGELVSEALRRARQRRAAAGQ